MKRLSLGTSLTPILLASFASLLLPTATGCGGYELFVHNFTSCGGDDSLRMINGDVKLGEDCMLKPAGCLETTKGFSKCTVKYNIVKDKLLPIIGEADGCKEMEKGKDNEDGAAVMSMLGLPDKCPVEKGKVCNDDKKVNVKKYEKHFPKAKGRYKGTVNLECDTGKTCFSFDMEVKGPSSSALG